MAKRIEFDYDNRHWTLEFNARTCKEVQLSGFKKDEIGDKSLVMLPLLFHGAFLMHHRGEKPSNIDEIFKLMGDKYNLYLKLIEMYEEPIDALTEEPEDESVKVNWTGNW